MTDELKIGEIKMDTISITSRSLELRAMFEESRKQLYKVFFHEPFYKDLMMAAFAARAKIGLEGFRGCGKSHAMDAMKHLIKANRTDANGETMMMEVNGKNQPVPLVWRVQGYLDADIEDTMVRPFIPSLMRGDEELIWKPATRARVKMFDEIQRLGVKALSTMFGMMDSGKVYYLEQEEGVYPFWAIFTMNPTETAEDNLNFAIPEPLIDRFDCMMWVPRAKEKYERMVKTQSEMRALLDSIPPIWDEPSLIDLWDEVQSIPIPDQVHSYISLVCRIISFCLYAQNYDATSLGITRKRALCGVCNKGYFCGRVARPPSVRAKQSWMQLAKGWAYRMGHKQVEQEDAEAVFPAVIWRRVQLMNEDDNEKFETADRLKLLRDFQEAVKKEIAESKSHLEAIARLKKAFSQSDYDSLTKAVNAKAWVKEQIDTLDEFHNSMRDKLMAKMAEAKQKKDTGMAMDASVYAKVILPKKLTGPFENLPFEMKINITPEFLASVASANDDIFQNLKDKQGKTETLDGTILQQLFKLQINGKLKLNGEVIWS
jgi:MoxR-like ATPase